MAHASGNQTWLDWPSTATPVTAAGMEGIESAIDGLVPGDWMTITMRTQWQGRDAAQGTSTYYAPRVRTLPGARAELNGTLFKTGGGANGEEVFLLPAGYRPARELVLPIMDSSGQPLGLMIRPTGVASLFANRTSAASLYLAGTFLLTAPV